MNFAGKLALFVALGIPLSAHRLDEYLQAALIGIEKDHVNVELNLTPGVSMLPAFFALVDQNGDQQISAEEQKTYEQRVIGDLTLELDGKSQPITLASSEFPTTTELKDGLGTIRLVLRAPFAGERRVILQNRHQPSVSVYLMNALLPPPDLEIVQQERDPNQTEIRLTYRTRGSSLNSSWTLAGGLGVAALLLLAFERRTRLER